MILIPALLSLAPAVVSRGCVLPGEPLKYWAVSDTFVDSKEPSTNFGRDMLLSGGPGKVIFLRFADLNRAVGAGQSLENVEIILSQEIGKPAKLKSAFKVTLPWYEGSDRRGDINKLMGTKPDANFVALGTTWNDRWTGDKPESWNTPASFGNSLPISGATSKIADDKLTISGLTSTFQQFLEDPSSNYGIALQFAEVCDFSSSDSAVGAPELRFDRKALTTKKDQAVIWIERTGDLKFRAHLSVAKGAPTAVKWNGKRIDGVQESTLGREVVLDFAIPAGNSKFAPLGVLSVSILEGDADNSNNSMDFYPAGKDVPFPIDVDSVNLSRLWNETILPQSRFSFALDGCRTRINLVDGKAAEKNSNEIIRASLGIPKLEGMGLFGGDTRDESQYARQLPMMYGPWSDQLFEQIAMPATDLLSMTAVGVLGASDSKLPKLVTLKMVTPYEQPLGPADVLATGPAGKSNLKLTADGYLVLSLSELATSVTDGPIKFLITTDADSKTVDVPIWQIYDASRRAGKSLGVISVGVPMSGIHLTEGTNLAAGKFPSDSQTSSAAELAKLTDGDSGTAMNIAKEAKWIEIDLGRDRLFGAVDVVTDTPEAFDSILAVVRETGANDSDARLFARMLQPAWHAKHWCLKEGSSSVLRLFGIPAKARYIRLIPKANNSAKISEIRVVPGKLD